MTLVDRQRGGLTDEGVARGRAGPAGAARARGHRRRHGLARRRGHRRLPLRRRSAPPPAGCCRSCSTQVERVHPRRAGHGPRGQHHQRSSPACSLGQLDAAVVHLPIDDAERQRRCRCSPRTCCCWPTAGTRWREHEQHPSGGARARSPLLLPPRGTALRRIIDRAAAAVDVELQAQAEIDGVRLLASLAFEGYGAGDRAGHGRASLVEGRLPAHRGARTASPRRGLGAAAGGRRPGAPTRALLGRAARRRRRAGREAARRARRRRGVPVGSAALGLTSRGRMQPVELRNRVVPALCSSDVREFEGRQVVWVDVDASERAGCAVVGVVVADREPPPARARAKRLAAGRGHAVEWRRHRRGLRGPARLGAGGQGADRLFGRRAGA